MDSASSDKADGKALPWTEEAKFQLLIRIVAQLRENGRSINWQKIDMPGRTVKSMQNMWTKINKMIAEVETEGGDVPIQRPTRGFFPPFSPGFPFVLVVGRAVDRLVMLAVLSAAGEAKAGGGAAKRPKKGTDDTEEEQGSALKAEPDVEA
ncbi:uncharacterized protein MAM_03877 [Metarhizium album ARSEF 1941]|uniref:Uncharacterized protein n=1 Tax=Metarhizium album (strain ARSEF 1941) TaxID=1081103 RepID=A0A0B2WPZ8_METAS|nr:uncharacterized protein MAM_03877 [Metarhizium album ARSEF 1941]KHN98116.1 hypothetical protein MAM_03877 [Metarhizium album ARSEF 1941]